MINLDVKDFMDLDELMDAMFGPIGDPMRDEFERIVELSKTKD